MALSIDRLKKIKEFQKKFNIVFNDQELLNRVFCHKSYVNDHKHEFLEDNERLEFFGDAVLKLVISEYLYLKYPERQEGYLTKLRAMIVSDATLADIALAHKMGEYLLLSKNDADNEGHKRKSTNANLLEAFFGACYLDQGLDYAREIIYRFMKDMIDQAGKSEALNDYKSMLQEHVQAMGWGLPKYKITKEDGPEHKKMFYLQVFVGNGWRKHKANGQGRTKKEAEQDAAKNILENELLKTK